MSGQLKWPSVSSEERTEENIGDDGRRRLLLLFYLANIVVM